MKINYTYKTGFLGFMSGVTFLEVIYRAKFHKKQNEYMHVQGMIIRLQKPMINIVTFHREEMHKDLEAI